MPEESDMEYKERRRSTTELWLPRNVVMICAAFAAIVSLAVALATVLIVTRSVNKPIRTSALNMCDGTNMLRGFARLATHENKPKPPDPNNLADYLLRIRDCEKTFDRQRITHVDVATEVEFLTALANFRRVRIRDGQVEPTP